MLWFQWDLDEAHTEFYRFDGAELVLELATGSANLWPTGEDLVVLPREQGDLFLIAGETFAPLRQGVRDAGYLGITGQRSPTGEWLFQCQTDAGREIAQIEDGAWVVIERGIESEVNYLSLDEGPYFIAFQSDGQWEVRRYDSERFVPVHTGYDAVTLSGEAALLTRGTDAGPSLTVCPLRGRDGPCVTAPEPFSEHHLPFRAWAPQRSRRGRARRAVPLARALSWGPSEQVVLTPGHLRRRSQNSFAEAPVPEPPRKIHRRVDLPRARSFS